MYYSRPKVRKILFYLSVIYSLAIPFISSTSALEIDRDAKTFQITFEDLQAPTSMIDSLESEFYKLDTGKNILAQTADFTLDTMHLLKEGKQLNAVIKYHYRDDGHLFELLNMDEDKEGVYFQPLDLEEMASTNGMKTEATDGSKLIMWKSGQNVLKIRIHRKDYPEGSGKYETKSVLNAWKKWKESDKH